MTLISLIRSLDLTNEYSIAGLRVFSNRVAEQEEVYTGTDGKLLAVYIGRETNTEEYADLLRKSDPNLVWHQFVNHEGLQVIGREDGQIILIRDRNKVIFNHASYASVLRFFTPFAAGLQKKLVLHASAVQTKDGVVAFIGASGVGKTTLAGRMNEIGFPPVADDLLPCRISQQNVVVPLAPSKTALPRQLSLARIYFLFRDTSRKRIDLSSLSRMQHLNLHLRNGFSELPLADSWKVQFVNYGKIVDVVPAFQMTLPDGIDYLEQAIRMLVGQPFPIRGSIHAPLSRTNVERTLS